MPRMFIPYGRQNVDRRDIQEVIRVLRSSWLTQGPKVAEFEKNLASSAGAKFAVAVSSGTAALHLAYLAGGLKKGDEVITTPNTFAATSNMLLAVGAKPVFCDIRPDTWNIDESKIEKLITPKTKAVVPVHFAGQPCEMEKILKFAQKHRLAVIEDACHALGAKYKGKKIGSMGDMTVFSFHPVKSITTGEGGAVLTDKPAYYRKLISLRSHGIHKDRDGKNVMTELGYNYRLTDIQAALGASQLKKLAYFIKERHKLAGHYRKALKDLKQIILPVELPGNYSSWHMFIIRVADFKLRDRLAAYLKAKGAGVNFHYPAVYAHPYYRQHGFANFSLPNEEIYQKSCLTLPCYPSLAKSQVDFVCRMIKNFFNAKAN